MAQPDTLTGPPSPGDVSGAGAIEAHELETDVVTLPQSVVMAVASAAPGASTQVTLFAMVAATAYATGPVILISMVPMLAIALCFQRLNLWEQNCGGPYVWFARAISPFGGFMVGWMMLIAWLLGSVADVLPLGPLLLSLIGVNTSAVLGNILTATLFGAIVTAVVALGIKATAIMQMVIAGVEYLILLVFSVIAFIDVYVDHRHGTVRPNVHWLSINGVGGKGSLAAGMLIAIFLFAGWDTSAYINEETQHRRTNPGRAVLLAVAFLGPFSIWLFIAFQGVVSQGLLSAHSSDELPYLAGVLTNGAGEKIMTVAIILSVIATTQAAILSISRISYSLSTDGLLPSLFGHVNAQSRTPVRATIFWGVLVVIIADLYVSSSSLGTAFGDIVDSQGVLVALFYCSTAFATIAYYRQLLRRSLVDVLLIGVFPLLGAGTLIWVVVKSFPGLDSTSKDSVIGILVLGIVLMAIVALRRSAFFAISRSSYDPDASTDSHG